MYSKSAPDRTGRRARVTRGWSLTALLTFWYTASAALLVILAASLLYAFLVHDVDREDDGLLHDHALLVDSLLMQRLADPRSLLLELHASRQSLGAEMVPFRIIDHSGTTALATPDIEALLPANRFPLPLADGEAVADASEAGHVFRLMTASLQSAVVGGPGSHIQMALDRGDEQALLASYRRVFLMVTLPTLLACVWIGRSLARRAIAPVLGIGAEMEAIQAASLAERVSTGGLAREFRPLAEAFNRLLARLADSFQRIRRYAASVAHELRTPLHNVCGEIDVALARPRDTDRYLEVLKSCREESQRMSNIVDGLHFIAHAQLPSARVERQSLDVAHEVKGVVDFFEAAVVDDGLQLRVEIDEVGTVEADKTLLQRAIANLVQNAINYTPRGGSVLINVARCKGSIEIAVADTGVGIAAEHLGHIWEGGAPPGIRDKSRPGLGLGLAIVRSIMQLHGGSVTIESQPGKGTRATLCFPDASERRGSPRHHGLASR